MSETPSWMRLPSVELRPLRADELVEPLDRATPFDDFGPRQDEGARPCRLDEGGALAILHDGVLRGEVSWTWNQWGPTRASRCAMIGIWLLPEHRGRGFGSAAQRELAGLMFRHTATNRVEAHTDIENIAEQNALVKAGFTREGVIRGAHWRNGAFHDGPLFSMLRADWERLREVPAAD